MVELKEDLCGKQEEFIRTIKPACLENVEGIATVVVAACVGQKTMENGGVGNDVIHEFNIVTGFATDIPGSQIRVVIVPNKVPLGVEDDVAQGEQGLARIVYVR